MLNTKKGMIDVVIWTMRYIRGDSLPSTDSINAQKTHFVNDFVAQHKCTGTTAVFRSAKYIGPIFRQRVQLMDDPDFTEKELYRRHNFAESNIHGGGKKKNDLLIAEASSNTTPVYNFCSDNVEKESPYSGKNLDLT